MRRSLIVACAIALAFIASVVIAQIPSNTLFSFVTKGDPTSLPPTPFPPTTVPPTPSPSTVTVLSSRGYRSSSSYYVVADVANTTSNTLYYVQVEARFYNVNNQLMAVSDGLTFLRQTHPQQRNSFKIVLSNAPSDIAHYALSLSWNTSSGLQYPHYHAISECAQ